MVLSQIMCSHITLVVPSCSLVLLTYLLLFSTACVRPYPPQQYFLGLRTQEAWPQRPDCSFSPRLEAELDLYKANLRLVPVASWPEQNFVRFWVLVCSIWTSHVCDLEAKLSGMLNFTLSNSNKSVYPSAENIQVFKQVHIVNLSFPAES